MHWTARTCLGLLAWTLGHGATALAQQAPATAPPATPPAATAPAAAPATGTPPGETAAPPAETAPAQAPPAEAAAPTPSDAPPPEPAPAPAPPATTEPPPPQYGRLGGTPEPEIKEGDWDPWEHAVAGKHRHEGFFLRLALGFGGGAVNGENGEWFDEVSYSGGGFGFDIAIGGALTENLILQGEIFQMTLYDPDVEEHPDRGYDTADDLGIEDIALAGLGIGVTYYFMPVNIYLSGTLAFGQVIYEDDQGDIDDSDTGLGLSFMAGKEWWVGVDWGIGVALQLLHVRTEERYDGDLSATSLGVMFSATHN